MKKGSVTVFTTLVLVLVLSFIFSLLESARVSCILARTERVTDICLQSMFGNYQEGLWKDYSLLFLDGCWQEGSFSMENFTRRAIRELEKNITDTEKYLGRKSWDLTAINPVSVNVNRYQLATDMEGQAFRHQVTLQMQMEVAEDILNELCQLKEQGEEAENQKKEKDSNWEQAWNAMEEAEEQKGEEQGSRKDGIETEDLTQLPEPVTTVENPMEYVKNLKTSSVLAMVLKDPGNLSGKSLADKNFISKRQLEKGNWEKDNNTSIADRIYLQYYIQKYFSNYVTESEKGPKDRVLSYEMEYLIGGKQRDSANLEKVVYELLAIREAMNFITIMQDTEKKALALGIATAAVGFTGMIPLVNAVQIGILLAWSYVESVLDLRTLLDGGNVPFLKRTTQWSSDLENCRGTIESHSQTQGREEGLSYANYLQILLFFLSEKTISYRCMDLIERNEQIKMDHMIQSVDVIFEYEAQPLFWGFNFVARNDLGNFSMPVEKQMSYGQY